jgi:hypothetical protein
MDRDDQELEMEDEIFEEIAEDEENDIFLDTVLLEVDESGREPLDNLVDPEDLTSGFDARIATREIDVDEDLQGDEVVPSEDEELMTQFEVPSTTPRVVHGDEIQLDLDEALATGTTVTRAPQPE